MSILRRTKMAQNNSFAVFFSSSALLCFFRCSYEIMSLSLSMHSLSLFLSFSYILFNFLSLFNRLLSALVDCIRLCIFRGADFLLNQNILNTTSHVWKYSFSSCAFLFLILLKLVNFFLASMFYTHKILCGLTFLSCKLNPWLINHFGIFIWLMTTSSSLVKSVVASMISFR